MENLVSTFKIVCFSQQSDSYFVLFYQVAVRYVIRTFYKKQSQFRR